MEPRRGPTVKTSSRRGRLPPWGWSRWDNPVFRVGAPGGGTEAWEERWDGAARRESRPSELERRKTGLIFDEGDWSQGAGCGRLLSPGGRTQSGGRRGVAPRRNRGRHAPPQGLNPGRIPRLRTRVGSPASAGSRHFGRLRTRPIGPRDDVSTDGTRPAGRRRTLPRRFTARPGGGESGPRPRCGRRHRAAGGKRNFGKFDRPDPLLTRPSPTVDVLQQPPLDQAQTPTRFTTERASPPKARCCRARGWGLCEPEQHTEGSTACEGPVSRWASSPRDLGPDRLTFEFLLGTTGASPTSAASAGADVGQGHRCRDRTSVIPFPWLTGRSRPHWLRVR